MSEYVGDNSAGFFGGGAARHAAVLRVVHTEAKRTLSRADFDMCLRIAEAAYAAAEQPSPQALTAKQRYDECMREGEEPSPIECLRFFCALAMDGQDWLDVEPFFDALLAAEQPAKALTDKQIERLRLESCDTGTLQKAAASHFARALLASPPSDKAEQMMRDIVAHGISVQRIAPADFLASQPSEDQRDAEHEDIGRLLHKAAGALPEGWEIQVHVERGWGGVALHDPEGETSDLDDGEASISEQIERAIDAAIAKGEGRE